MKKSLLSGLAWLALWSSSCLAGVDQLIKAFEEKNYNEGRHEASTLAAQGDGLGNYFLGLTYLNGWGVPPDPAAALEQFQIAVSRGERLSQARLAEIYWRGRGTTKDHEKAIHHAREAMVANILEGGFLVYLILTNEHLNYMTPQGKPDQSRYVALAARPIAERSIDQEAKDALYWAADGGYPMAMNMLALMLGGTLGEGNPDRMLKLTERLRQSAMPAVKQYEQITRHQKSLGNSFASPQLFKDTLAPQMLAAKIKLCSLADNAKKAEVPKLISMRRIGEINNPAYLASRFPEYRTANLIAGEWREAWTFEACGRRDELTVSFKADGFGGANMIAEPISLRPESKTPANIP